jgi:DNA-directed RNA polymerase III subunit RPC5
MELDIGMNIHGDTFDKAKGVTLGDSMRIAKEGGLNAFGVASGFGKGGRTNELFAAERAQLQPTSEERIDDMVFNFEETARKGCVLNKKTLGGQIVRPEHGQPTYMLGAFRGSEYCDFTRLLHNAANGTQEELHLSHIEGVAQMRPQFHHIDAKSQLAKAKSARDRPGNESARFNEPRLIQQTARTAGDGEEINIAKTSEYLTAASEEHWLRLKYNDEDVRASFPFLMNTYSLEKSEDAYLAYGESLFLNDTLSAKHLGSPLSNEEYLDEISIARPDSGMKHRRRAHTAKRVVTGASREAESQLAPGADVGS